ncbi:tRNA (adenosine(37)-N6)-threonylcarbamoyltransferase complex dimerization subunit type 1 TsaB [Paenibacillus dakarensis]|uniref:tRNA (adenosine(37)-N6)-threonylcarbamoyltransferase complex dimerization subunit type 1 TsaB n=1 Tax=Paenibacillus dakarensis TaxID=1527293 RepID=UPI0006D5B204|nr:tRNA (adenosine(37)-N6)-threonylcarbamoyltransferase complex dimerization subunit type 1 TsaB [Paenibacillus dakarensis]
MNNQNTKPRQRFLALDSATASLAVAVMENMELMKEINASGERNHSVHMHPVIARAVEEANLTIEDIDGIAVGVGPGSYTGVRMAVTAAKTLAWAKKIPVVGVSSLHALAWGGLVSGQKNSPIEGEQHWIIPLLDARRGQAYTALFVSGAQAEANVPNRLEPDAIRLMSAWIDTLSDRLKSLKEEERPASIWFTGDVEIHTEAAKRLSEVYHGPLNILPYELEGRWVGRLGAEQLLRGVSDEVHTLVPNYTQLSEAEANLLRKR